MKRMLCWMRISNSHGRVGHTPLWMPEGDEPEVERNKYERAPWLDEPKKKTRKLSPKKKLKRLLQKDRYEVLSV